MQQRLPSIHYPPLAFAHRGASSQAPENTIAAFALAAELGATGIESDVWRTADGTSVLVHDGTIRAGLRRKPISALTRAELPATIPTLADLLAAAPAATHISLDLKAPDIGRKVIDEVSAVDPDRLRRLWLCSPSADDLVALREHDPLVRLVHSTELSALPRGAERHAADLAAAAIDAVRFHHTNWSGGRVALYHRFEVLAFAWDLQFDHHLHNVVRMGIDAVYGNHVDVMLAAIAAECPPLGEPG